MLFGIFSPFFLTGTESPIFQERCGREKLSHWSYFEERCREKLSRSLNMTVIVMFKDRDHNFVVIQSLSSRFFPPPENKSPQNRWFRSSNHGAFLVS